MSEEKGLSVEIPTNNVDFPGLDSTEDKKYTQSPESDKAPEEKQSKAQKPASAAPKKRVFTTKFITKTSILGVIAFLIMLVEFPLPIFAPFLQLDFSDVPALLAGFAMGPSAGVAVEVIKNFLHALRTQTAFIGELANLITGILLVVPAAWIYSKNKTKKGAIQGLLVGTVVMAIGNSFVNYYITIPLFQTLLNIPTTAVIGMGTEINPLIVDLRTLVVYSVLPFNIVKGLIVTLITVLIYKKLSPILHR